MERSHNTFRSASGWDGHRRGGRGHARHFNQGQGGQQQEKIRHPGHLRGAEIGMFYASRAKNRKQNKDKPDEAYPAVVISTTNGPGLELKKCIQRLDEMEEIKPLFKDEYTSLCENAKRFAVWHNEIPEKRHKSDPVVIDLDTPDVDTNYCDDATSTAALTFDDEFLDESFEAPGTSNTPVSSMVEKDSSGTMKKCASYGNMDEISTDCLFGEYGIDTDVEAVKREQTLFKRVLKNNDIINTQLRSEFVQKQKDKSFQNVKKVREKLPIWSYQNEIVKALEDNQVLVLSGETGCGKSTQVPQFVLDSCIATNRGSTSYIVITQPRRISAIALAERVAYERSESLGQSVGYKIRLKEVTPRENGSILYCTAGIVLRWLMSDPSLQRVSHLVLDEIHERDLVSDFLLIITRDLLPQRPDLKLILMSATLDAEKFARYFEKTAPLLHVKGFTYPVEEFFLEDIVSKLNYFPPPNAQVKPGNRLPKSQRYRPQFRQQAHAEHDKHVRMLQQTLADYPKQTVDAICAMDQDRIDNNLVITLTRHLVATSPPDESILIFVPGWTDISKLIKEMRMDTALGNSERFKLIPLHSMIPLFNQRDVFNRPPSGVRKVVVATNIAETSITIDDVVHVIDCGKIKISNFDVENNIQTISPEWITLANAKQRAGRAGRTRPGKCYHLFTKHKLGQLHPHIIPEMLRERLESLCLQVKSMSLGYCVPFLAKALDPPPIEGVKLALDELYALGAIDTDENLTKLGTHLAKLPMDPHCGKMIIYGAIFSCLEPILSIASILDFKDPFYTPLGREQDVDYARLQLAKGTRSDHLMYANVMQTWERESGSGSYFARDHFLSLSTMRMLQNMKKQFAGLLHSLGFLDTENGKDARFNRYRLGTKEGNKVITAVVAAGLYPKVAQISKVTKRKTLMRSKLAPRIEFHPKSVNKTCTEFDSNYLVYHLMVKSSGSFLHDSSSVYPIPLLLFGGNIKLQQNYELSSGQKADIIILDEFIRFLCDRETARLFFSIRNHLDRMLDVTMGEDLPGTFKSLNSELLMRVSDLIAKENICRPVL